MVSCQFVFFSDSLQNFIKVANAPKITLCSHFPGPSLFQSQAAEESKGAASATMEIDNEHMEELTKLETVQQKAKGDSNEIEFDKIKVSDLASSKRDEYRKIPVPRHRITPLR